MKDYKYLASSDLVKAVEKRDTALIIVSVMGSVLMSGCWVLFLLGISG